MFSTFSPVFCCFCAKGPDISMFLYIFGDAGLLCAALFKNLASLCVTFQKIKFETYYYTGGLQYLRGLKYYSPIVTHGKIFGLILLPLVRG